MRGLSCVVTLAVIVLLTFGPSVVAGAQKRSDNAEAAQKQSAPKPTLQEQPVQGQPAQGQASQGQAPQGQASQGQPAQGQPAQGQASQGQVPQGQPAQGQAPQGQPAQGQAPQGQASKDQGGQKQQGVRTLPILALAQVTIQDSSFEPANSTIAPQTTVAWVNQGAEPHTVTADDGSFDSGTLNPGDHFLLAFEGQGTVTYHCSLHPEMVGSVTVSEGGDGSVPTGGTQAPATQQQPSENTSQSTDGGSGT